MSGFEKDMLGFIHDTHAALTESPFQLIATIESRIACQGLNSLMTIIRAVKDMILKAAMADCAFFHRLTRYKGRKTSFFISQRQMERARSKVYPALRLTPSNPESDRDTTVQQDIAD